ncbi:MAG: ROK family protein [Bacteroidales bacterium]|nr:ROK family protein [Bacteroidales bacterium]
MDYSIGIDIGGTNTVIGLVDNTGTVVEKEKLKTRDFTKTDDYLKAITAKIELLADRVKEENLILGVGIGAPNGNYYHGTIEYAPNLPFEGIIELKEILEVLLLKDGYNLKVTVTNDANAAAIGEMIYGKAKKVKNFIMITLGTGVGSGIVVDGKLVYGHTGFAGEVGHTIIEPNGRQCNCGRKGCVERYASATGIVLTIKEMLDKSAEESVLRAIDRDEITSKDIYEAALKGDKLALDCFDYTAKQLALGIANASEITSPEKVYLFGGLAKSGDFLLIPLKKYLNEFLFNVFQNTIDVELSGLKEEDAAVLGAAALCY